LSCNTNIDTWAQHTADLIEEPQEHGLTSLADDSESDAVVDIDYILAIDHNEQSGPVEQSSAENHVDGADTEHTHVEFDITDADTILKSLRSDMTANKNSVWDAKNGEYILEKLQSRDGLLSLRDVDLKIILKY
jgi:hypothetical protein